MPRRAFRVKVSRQRWSKAALTAFNEDAAVTEYYGIDDYQGVERFRYLQALEAGAVILEVIGKNVGFDRV